MHSADRGETWSDGMTWYPGHYRAIAVGSGTFVAVGETMDGKGLINTTQNGAIWSGEQIIDAPLTDVTFGAGRFVATDNLGQAYVSTDGVNWTKCEIKNEQCVPSVRYVNGVFLASSEHNGYYWSLDGESWFEEQGFLPRNVLYSGGLYLGNNLNGRFFSASGLDQWKSQPTVPYRFTSFAYGDPGAFRSRLFNAV